MMRNLQNIVALALTATILASFGCADSESADGYSTDGDTDARSAPIDPCRGPSTTILSDTSVSGGITLEKDGCYYVRGRVTLREGSMVIEEGVELSFLDDRNERAGRLIVAESASLVVDGTESNPVILHTRLHRRGQSRGVKIEPGSTGNRIEHAVFERNGEDTSHVALDIAGSAVVTRTVFRDNAGYAMAVRPEATLVGFADNALLDNERALLVAPEHVAALDAATQIERNRQNYIHVTHTVDTEAESRQTWSPLGAPYLVSGMLRVTDELTIAADTRIEFVRDAGILVEDTGSLTLDGTNAQRVIMVPGDEYAGWRGIRFNTDSELNVIRHASIGGAGSRSWTNDEESAAAVVVGEEFIQRGSVTFENANIFDSAADGVRISEGDLSGCETITFGDVDGERVRVTGTNATADCAPSN